MATKTIPARQLEGLPTPELIGQYDWALRDFKGRRTNTSPRQKRINNIVDMLSARADAGDAAAVAWFDIDRSNSGTSRQPSATDVGNEGTR